MPSIQVGFIPVGEPPRLVTIEGVETDDGEVSFYDGIRELIGCRLIDTFDPLYGETPLLIVDDEGVFNSRPNRAIYANKRMVEVGYLSQQDPERVVEENELYSILFGNIVAVSYDRNEEGDEVARDITQEEFRQLYRDFKYPEYFFKPIEMN